MANIIAFPAFSAAPASAPSAGLVDRVKKFFADRRLYRATVQELSRLTDRELADLGVNRASIREIARRSVYAA